MPKQRSAAAGFTLIEMAIVVALFGLIVGGGLVSLGAYMDKQAIDLTRARMDKIDRSLTLYVIRNGYLPCPADSDGDPVANCDDGTGDARGTVFTGVLPYADMGLLRRDVQNGWNQDIEYTVDTAYTEDQTAILDTIKPPTTDNYADAYDLCGYIDLQVSAGTSRTADDACDDGALEGGYAWPVYILVSPGENGASENTDGDITFVESGDDILHARTAAQIIRDAQ